MKYNFLTLGLLVFAVNAFGQVGVGTETPAATLDVKGKETSTSAIDGLIAPRISLANLNAKSTIYTAAQTGTILYVNDLTSATGLGKTANIDTVGYYYFDGNLWNKFYQQEPWLVQGSTNVATANTQNIYQTGNVAIGSGSTAPTSTAKLYVAGDVESTGKFISTSSVYADYVFEKYFTGFSELKKSYKFKSLTEVKNFVKKNHHLPGVTPVGDIIKDSNGYKVDLSALTMQQLEKLEELYLHVIEQQEQINAKNQEIETLQQNQSRLEKRLLKLEQHVTK